jgi:hypothetical protein
MTVKVIMRIESSCLFTPEGQWRTNLLILVVESVLSPLANDAAYELMVSNTTIISPLVLQSVVIATNKNEEKIAKETSTCLPRAKVDRPFINVPALSSQLKEIVCVSRGRRP